MFDFDTALQDVSKAFRSPRDILAAELSPRQKDRLLEQWEYDLRSQQVATDEAMISARPGTTGQLLQQVKDCRTELGLSHASDKPGKPPNMQGGA